ncbi:DUF3221 domain-containing protein [Paenibacillus contaminans]|uniref:DUF3221 domain-containing protein n=1 Tax=Paenibacillus contaminans TaxID=450362 RepID=A0A329M836_9BACL|nr:DUF3221 domain-containing protein [Paenibacillus contaminans]RAV16105.1 hypothetical protein DQG23_29375 [Paenibacillus contaminans]
MAKLIYSIMVLVFLAACGQPQSQAQQQPAQPSAADGIAMASHSDSSENPSTGNAALQADELNDINKKLSAGMEELERKHPVKFLGVGSGGDHILVMIRRAGDFEKPLTEAEIGAFKQSLYAIADKEFPLKLDVGACCDREAGIAGKIKKIEDGRVLVLDDHKKNGNTDDPYAAWIKLTDDGKIVRSDGSGDVPFEALAEGIKVKAWFTGIMLESYPGQTSALKIELQ